MTTGTSGTGGMSETERLRAEIDLTRQELSSDVNALADTARPGNVARRQVGRVKGAAADAKDRIMGSSSDATSGTTSGIGDKASALGDKASAVGGSVSDTVSDIPGGVRRRTEGSPLAAGLIAFGVGWLAASLIPASRAEQQLAAQAKEQVQPLAEQAQQAAQQVAENLREPAQEAVESVKSTAQEAVSHTKDEGADTAQQVKADAQQAAGEVRDSRT